MKFGMHIVQQQVIKQTMHIKDTYHLLSVQELFSADLRTLVKIENEIAAPKAEHTNSDKVARRHSNDTRPLAFDDTWLASLVTEHSIGQEPCPDANIRVQNSRAVPEFCIELSSSTSPVQQKLHGEEGLIRDNKARQLLRNISWVKNTIVNLLRHIVECQEGYLIAGNIERLSKLTLADVAKHLKVSTSTVYRLIEGRTITAPDGTVMPLRSLCLGQDQLTKLRFIKGLAKRYPTISRYPELEGVPPSYVLENEPNNELSGRTIRKYTAEMKDYKLKVDQRRLRERPSEN